MNLLQDKFDPITKEIGFLECNLASVAAAYQSWMKEALQTFEMWVESSTVEGNLETVLNKLLPLTGPTPRRFAFVPTKSAWTAYFDNSRRGTDSSGVVHVLTKKLNCRGIRVVNVPNTMPSRPSRETRGRFGATILEVCGGDGKPIRILYAMNDGGRWKFDESGTAFAFEEKEAYNSKRLRDRFTGEMLDRYLGHLGITAFDGAFYTSDVHHSVLFSRCGELPVNFKEIALEDIER